MDHYSLLRAFADSWMLLALTAFYVGAILWAFRPGAGALHAEIAAIPLRDDAAPPPRPTPALPSELPPQGAQAGCGKGCPDCRCAAPRFEETR